MSRGVRDSEAFEKTLGILRARSGDLSRGLSVTSVADFMALLEYSRQHGVTPALVAGIRNLIAAGLCAPELIALLEAVEQKNAERNEILYNAALNVANSLHGKGVSAIFLKGAAVLLESRNYAAWRTITDLDILVLRENVQSAAEALLAKGYRKRTDRRGFEHGLHHHYPAIYDKTTGTLIELHVRLMRDSSLNLLSTEEVFLKTVQLIVEGQSVLIPCPEHRMIQLIAHAQISNWGYVLRRIILKDVIDAVELSANYQLDWDVVRKAFTNICAENELMGFIWVAHKLMNLKLPFCEREFRESKTWANAAIRTLYAPEKTWRTVARVIAQYLKLFTRDLSRLLMVWKLASAPAQIKRLLKVNRGRMKNL